MNKEIELKVSEEQQHNTPDCNHALGLSTFFNIFNLLSELFQVFIFDSIID